MAYEDDLTSFGCTVFGQNNTKFIIPFGMFTKKMIAHILNNFNKA